MSKAIVADLYTYQIQVYDCNKQPVLEGRITLDYPIGQHSEYDENGIPHKFEEYDTVRQIIKGTAQQPWGATEFGVMFRRLH